MPTYYVIGAGGSDSNGGTNDTSDGWATIDHAMNNVIAGDVVYVKASATYNEQAEIDTVGASATPITFEGYTTTPGDGGKATIDGTTYCITAAIASNLFYTFKNFIFTAASSHGCSFGGGDMVAFYNCDFTSNGGHGCSGNNNFYFFGCTMANNTLQGTDVDGNCGFAFCKAYGNGGEQLYALGVYWAHGNLGYGGSGTDSVFNLPLNNGGSAIFNTLDGEGSATYGWGGFAGTYSLSANNIVHDAATYAIRAPSSNLNTTFFGFNLLNGHSSFDYYTGVAEATGPMIGVGDINSAPAFTDEAGDDYTLASDSPARDAGLGVS